MGFLIPLALWAVLVTPWGGRRVREKVLALAADTIQGSLALGPVRLGPGLELRADTVRLRAPDGADALIARKLTATVDPVALMHGRIAVRLVADGAIVDLSPDRNGSPALARAIAPVHPADPNAPPSQRRLEIALLVRDGHLVRNLPDDPQKAIPAEGEAPPGSPWAKVGADSVDFVLAFSTAPSLGTQIRLDGTADLTAPAFRPITYHLDLSMTTRATRIRCVRVIAGASRIAVDDLDWSDGILAGTFGLRLDPAEIAIAAPSVKPAGALLVEAAAGPLDGVQIANARISLENADGTLSLSARRRSDGLAVVSMVANAIDPAAWGVPEVPARRIGAVIAAARTSDGRIAARIRASPAEFPRATLDRLTASLTREPDGRLAVLLEAFDAHDEHGKWKLVHPARIGKDGERITIAGVALDGPHGQRVRADGAWPPSPRAPLRASARALALHELPAEMVPSLAPLAGFVDLDLRLVSAPRPGAPPEGVIALTVRDASWAAHGPVDVSAAATLHRGLAHVTGYGREWRGGRFSFSLDAPSRVPGPSDRVVLVAAATGMRVGALRGIAGLVHGGLDHGRAWIVAHASAEDRELLRVAATSAADWRALAAAGPARALDRPPPFALTLARLDLRALAAMDVVAPETEGIVSGVVVSDGRGDARGNLSIEGARVPRASGLAVALSLHSEPGHALASLVVRDAAGAEGSLGASARFAGARPLLAGDLTSLRWALRGAINDLPVGEATGTDTAPEALRRGPPISGALDAAIAVDGAGLALPGGWVYAAARKVAVRDQMLGAIRLAARLGEGGAAAWVGAEPSAGGRLAVLASLRGRPGEWLKKQGAWRAAPLFVALVAEKMPLAPVSPFLRDYGRFEGLLAARGVVHGTIDRPDPSLQAEVTDGAFQRPDIGRVTGIELLLLASKDKVELRKGIAHGGSGRLLATALMVARNEAQGRTWRLSGAMNARQFRLSGSRFAGDMNADAHVAGELSYPRISADITVDSGHITIPDDSSNKQLQPLSEHPDLVVIHRGQPADVQLVSGSDSAVQALQAKLRVKLPGNFWVKGKDVNIELRGDLTAKTGGKAKEPRLDGWIEAVRGDASVAGKKFVIDHARITFPDEPVMLARLDVHATHTMDDVDKTKVFAEIGGTVASPVIVLTSDPPMPQDAVASLLILGPTDPRSRSAADQPSLAGRAATFVGNYVTQQLRDQLVHVVPLDVLELEPGASGSAAEGRLRVGKYIAPGLFLSYAHAFGAAPDEGSNAVRVEYRFAHAWELMSEFTDANRGNVDLIWTSEF